MYAKDTILVLKEQKGADTETGEEFPYNRVEVVGVSPVSHSHRGEWEGGSAEGVLLRPLTNFGATLDEPFGKLQTLYDVESIPDPNEVEVAQKIKIIDGTSAQAGPTPEEVFAEEAPGKAPEQGQKRARTSPLGDAPPPNSGGPLGNVEAPELEPKPPVSPLDKDALAAGRVEPEVESPAKDE